MNEIEKTVRDLTKNDLDKIIDDLKWILKDDKFGFGENWTEKSEPADEYEQAWRIIQRTINYLKEQDDLLREKSKNIFELCVEVTALKHQLNESKTGGA